MLSFQRLVCALNLIGLVFCRKCFFDAFLLEHQFAYASSFWRYTWAPKFARYFLKSNHRDGDRGGEHDGVICHNHLHG